MARQTGPSYKAYKKAYEAKKASLLRRGLTMNDKMYTESEYKFQYKLERAEMVADVREGKRKAVGNVNQRLVERQTFELDINRARALQASARERGIKLTIAEIRAGMDNLLDQSRLTSLYDEIKSTYSELRDASYSSKEAGAFIGQFYYGSI